MELSGSVAGLASGLAHYKPITQWMNVQTGTNTAWRSACFLIAAIALGIAVQIRDGLIHPTAIAYLAVAVLACSAGLLKLPGGQWQKRLPLIAGFGIAVQLAIHFGYQPPQTWSGGHSIFPYYLFLSVATVAGVGMIVRPARSAGMFGLALFAFAGLGGWILIAGPKPKMDVWMAQTAGIDAAIHGHDPWSSSFPDVYGKPTLYAPGTVRDGRTYLGFPYPPVTLLMDLPGHLLLGDYRWDNLLAMLLTAVMIARMWPGTMGRVVALLFLFTPRALLVLRNGWTEPTVTLLLAATVLSVKRRPAWTPWLLGMLLASKQYMFIVAAPALVMLRPRELDWTTTIKWCGKVFLVGMLVSLPLILWNPAAYMRSNFAAAAGAACRYDALSFFAYWADTHNWTPPIWIGAVSLIVAMPVTILAIKRCESTAGGFAAACAIVMIFFFSLNKFAFCNYFYLVIATLGVCVTASQPESAIREESGSVPADLRLAA
jgi:hypothetical protein